MRPLLLPLFYQFGPPQTTYTSFLELIISLSLRSLCVCVATMNTTALPDMKPEERFSIEELDHEGKANATAKGGTPNDDREMHRMGKVQELRVSSCCSRPHVDAVLLTVG